jgi:hypothetical protein
MQNWMLSAGPDRGVVHPVRRDAAVSPRTAASTHNEADWRAHRDDGWPRPVTASRAESRITVTRGFSGTVVAWRVSTSQWVPRRRPSGRGRRRLTQRAAPTGGRAARLVAWCRGRIARRVWGCIDEERTVGRSVQRRATGATDCGADAIEGDMGQAAGVIWRGPSFYRMPIACSVQPEF